MSSQIALNKTSGGQMIITPEDGTTTETVTIPPRIGKQILQQVVSTDTISYSYTATSPIAIGEATTIVPVSSTSELYCFCTLNHRFSSNGSGDMGAFCEYYYYDGTSYVNPTGAGTNSQSPLVTSGSNYVTNLDDCTAHIFKLGVVHRRSDTGSWTVRPYGNVQYAGGSNTMYVSQCIFMEIEV